MAITLFSDFILITGQGDGVSTVRTVILSNPPYNIFVGQSLPVGVRPYGNVRIENISDSLPFTVDNLHTTPAQNNGRSGTCTVDLTLPVVPLGISWNLYIQLVY